MPLFGAIEAGGTKFVCGVGTGPEDLQITQIPTTSPEPTLAAVIEWLRKHSKDGSSNDGLRAIGIGSFGPVDIDPASPTYGFITNTPKISWQNYNLAGAVQKAFAVPVHFTSDVNAAILAEARWGAARDIPSCVYLTIGTGIGGSALSSGRLLHGTSHPEMGHIRVPHDLTRDPFPGICPFHGDCLEGLASGPAIEARWGKPAATLPPDHPAWTLEAQYLAQGIANIACILAPHRILPGGGVMEQSFLIERIRLEVARLLADYVTVPEIQPPQLGQRAGVLGALSLAISPALGTDAG
jgi:fructokinase